MTIVGITIVGMTIVGMTIVGMTIVGMTIVGTNIVETTIVKTAIMKIKSGKIITDNPYPNKGKNCLYTTLEVPLQKIWLFYKTSEKHHISDIYIP